jgi:hypothetical protein
LTQEGRPGVFIVLPNKKVWIIYSVVGGPDWAGGLITGTISTQGTTWKMDNAFLLERMYQVHGEVDANGTWQNEIQLVGNARITHDPPVLSTPPYQDDGFDFVYDSRSKTAFNMATVAGRYTGLIAVPTQEMELILAANGTVTGRSADGCGFSGKATATGSVANFTATYNGGVTLTTGQPCEHGTATVTGILYADIQARMITVGALSANKQQWFLFMGKK